jgi:hypothetical protein
MNSRFESGFSFYRRISGSAITFIVLAITAVGQNAPTGTGLPTTSNPAAIALLNSSVTAQVGTTTVNDVSLSASGTLTIGPSQQSGATQLKATAVGQSRIDLSLSTGTNTEIRTIAGIPGGEWSSGSSTENQIPAHNLLSDPSWFFPLLGEVRALGAQYVVQLIGSDSVAGKNVTHLQISQLQPAVIAASTFAIQKLSQSDLYIDSTTLLPVALFYNTHPDNDANTNISIQVLYSNYQTVNGMQVPFTIQKFINNSPVLNLQVQSAAFNTGLTAANFTLQ